MEEGIDYLKVGKASDLPGRNRQIYRILEILPGAFSILTLVVLSVMSYFQPVWVAYFIIAFDVYWLLLVIYMAIFLITAYRKLKKGLHTDWLVKCDALRQGNYEEAAVGDNSLVRQGKIIDDIWHLIILPTYQESTEIIRGCVRSLVNDGWRTDRMIVAVTFEGRSGREEAERKISELQAEFGAKFSAFFTTIHPDNMAGELKGKGANQAWCAKEVRREVIDARGLAYENILVSVFDIDTVVRPGYFAALTYKFMTVNDPYHTSYQPIPVYHNNIWRAPFFSRVAASSNTFWQMIMQIREESLVTYSSHSMTWKALVDIGFWSTKNVSEDSRIFWHCLMHYNGHYRVEPIHYEVSMDVTHDESYLKTAKSLYKQQRRWAWGAENIPYLLFNASKRWRNPGFERRRVFSHILIQIYGFHAWATNAIIIAVIGWLPLLFGGERFTVTVLSGNLPAVTTNLMNVAMIGLILSAVVSALLLPKKPAGYPSWKKGVMILEWIAVPVTIVVFGAIPCLEAQIRLMAGKYMGFWVTPKTR